MGERVLRLSSIFRRSVEKLGVRAGTPAYSAMFRTLRALVTRDLPGAGDYRTAFLPGHASVRRAAGHNLWLLYRFDEQRVFVMTVRAEPPIPMEQ